MVERSNDPDNLEARLRTGKKDALAELFMRSRERLLRMVGAILDARLRGRLDPADVVQESFLEATRRFDEYLANPDLTGYLWLRLLTAQRVQLAHRQHFGVQARDVRREVPLWHFIPPEASSLDLACCILDSCTTPRSALMQREREDYVQQALAQMDPLDREVLALRHFDQLSNSQTAHLLGIQPAAAGMRYFRALARLREILLSLPGGGEVLLP